jgi:hypothetical protein
MLAKNAAGPGAWEAVGLRRKIGDSLHSRARRVAASTAIGFGARVVGMNLGGEGEFLGDLMFVKGLESIKAGSSRTAANPPSQ